jgi:transcriptional regulator with XRE-family HTH domain
MFANPSDRRKRQSKLTTLGKSKSYRDAYLTGHVRAGIAYQIQALREQGGLSQNAFAKKVGTTQSVISRLENPDYGKVTVQTLLQVAVALNIALFIRFCSYLDFLAAIDDVSPSALYVDNIYTTLKHPEYQLRQADHKLATEAYSSVTSPVARTKNIDLQTRKPTMPPSSGPLSLDAKLAA